MDREEKTDAQDASSGGTDRQYFVFCHACPDDTWPDGRAAAANRSTADKHAAGRWWYAVRNACAASSRRCPTTASGRGRDAAQHGAI